ncbi:MAG: lipoyl(octanoyl) transferase LipB [Xanthomonadales bacterium]|nr:lipoyl(octanoyl) transferase LipB [Xanthomonadales bacterium]
MSGVIRPVSAYEMNTLGVRDLGMRDYQPVWESMQQFTDSRGENSPDELWLLEHQPVFTQGQAGKAEHLLAPGDIPVLQVDRGGQVTYHGPGQLIAYPLLDIRRRKLSIRDMVHAIEQAIINTLADFEIQAERNPGAPGVYVGAAKIAALGLRIRKGCSFHGLSLNIDMNTEPFARINPCGFQGLEITQVIDQVPTQNRAELSLSKVKSVLVGKLLEELHYGGVLVLAAGIGRSGIDR